MISEKWKNANLLIFLLEKRLKTEERRILGRMCGKWTKKKRKNEIRKISVCFQTHIFEPSFTVKTMHILKISQRGAEIENFKLILNESMQNLC